MWSSEDTTWHMWGRTWGQTRKMSGKAPSVPGSHGAGGHVLQHIPFCLHPSYPKSPSLDVTSAKQLHREGLPGRSLQGCPQSFNTKRAPEVKLPVVALNSGMKASLGTCVLHSCQCVLIPGHSRNRYRLFPCCMMEPQRQNWSGPRTLTAKSRGGVDCHPTASSANRHTQGVASWPMSLHSGQRP